MHDVFARFVRLYFGALPQIYVLGFQEPACSELAKLLRFDAKRLFIAAIHHTERDIPFRLGLLQDSMLYREHAYPLGPKPRHVLRVLGCRGLHSVGAHRSLSRSSVNQLLNNTTNQKSSALATGNQPLCIGSAASAHQRRGPTRPSPVPQHCSDDCMPATRLVKSKAHAVIYYHDSVIRHASKPNFYLLRTTMCIGFRPAA